MLLISNIGVTRDIKIYKNVLLCYFISWSYSEIKSGLRAKLFQNDTRVEIMELEATGDWKGI